MSVGAEFCQRTLPMAFLRRQGALFVEEPRVDEPRWDAAHKGGRPEDPVVVPDASHKRRAERARGVDAHAADGTLQPHQQRHN